MLTRRTAVAGVVAASLVLAACQTGGREQDEPALRLDEATLRSERVEELDRVRFEGIDLSADLSELELTVSSEQSEPFALPLYLDDVGLYATVPLHPATPGEGGMVDLQLRSDDEVSPVLALELTGLPPAAGAWDAFVDDLVAALDDRARAGGSTLEAVRSTPFDQLDGSLAIVRLAAEYVDNGTDADLESLLESGELGLTAPRRALLDAVIAKLDPLRMVRPPDTLPEFTRPATAAGLGGATDGVVTAAARGGVRPVRRSDLGPAPLAQGERCRDFDLEIDTPEQLAAAMQTGVGSQIREGGAVDQLTQDAAALGTMVDGLPWIGDLMTVVGAAYGTLGLLFNADAGRYPTLLPAIAVQLDTDQFNEDYTDPGHVTEVQVRAESTGFDASKELAQIATEVVNAVLAKAASAKLKQVGAGPAEELFLGQGQRLQKLVINQLLTQYSGELLTWCPQSWAVDITGPKWVDLSGIARLDTNRLQQSYEPNSVGDATLRVAADPEAFAGVTVSKDVPMRVDRLDVEVSPPTIHVSEPGETVTITAEVYNASSPTLWWDPGAGRWTDGTGSATNAGGTRTLQTPTDEDAYPFDVRVESTSHTGLRATASDERYDTVTVRLQELVVDPDPGRVRPRGELRFTATDPSGEPVEVRWDATGGRIDENGVYVADEVEGTFEVTATPVDRPEEAVTVDVIISEPQMSCLDVAGALGRIAGVIFVPSGADERTPLNFPSRQAARDFAEALGRYADDAPLPVAGDFALLERLLAPLARQYAEGDDPLIDATVPRAIVERIGDWFDASCS